MSEEKVIKLFTDGEVETSDKRQFTRLLGGFKDNNASLTDLQISKILNYKHGARQVREQVNRNKEHFEYGLDIIDLQRDELSDTSMKVLKTLGYAKQSITQASNIYIFSKSGFLLFLKFAEGNEAINIYKNFIEEYFKTKAKNETMKKSIEDEIKALEKDRYKISGLAVFNPVQDERVEAQKKLLNLDNRIIKMQSAIDNKKIRNSLEKQAKLTESKARYITQAEFGSRFNNKLGAKMIGKLLKIVGIAKKSYKRTVPYQEFVPKYAVNIINNDKELDYDIYYKWNYNECSKYINQWLLDNDYHDEFYGIIEKDELVKFIDKLYDTYVINNEEAI